jgi:hypothetical protein
VAFRPLAASFRCEYYGWASCSSAYKELKHEPFYFTHRMNGSPRTLFFFNLVR